MSIINLCVTYPGNLCVTYPYFIKHITTNYHLPYMDLIEYLQNTYGITITNKRELYQAAIQDLLLQIPTDPQKQTPTIEDYIEWISTINEFSEDRRSTLKSLFKSHQVLSINDHRIPSIIFKIFTQPIEP